MFVQAIQSTKFAKPMVRKAAAKTATAKQKLSNIAFPQAKIIIADPQKRSIYRMGSGGSVCTGSYSVESPDLYSC